MNRPLRRRAGAVVLLALGALALPFTLHDAALSAPAPVQPPGLDHFICYDVPTLGPLSEPVPFGLTPPFVNLIDQFGPAQAVPEVVDRLCNPVNKILPNGTSYPPTNPNAHLVCDRINELERPVVNVRVANQFGSALLTAMIRERLCLPTWKQDVQNPTAPGSVPVPVAAGTPVQPPGLDHFQCYVTRFRNGPANQFKKMPPFVTLVDQFRTVQVPVLDPVELCNPVIKILPNGQQFPSANRAAHLVCFRIDTQFVERQVRVQNQFGTATMLVGQGTRLCLPSYKNRLFAPADFDGTGSTDISVFRPSTATWYVFGGATTVWGTAGDIPAIGDYDGDGTTDTTVFRPSTGTWYVFGGATTAWGTSGDVPVPADYDGNGSDDVAVFRPSTGTWFVNGGPTLAFGTSGDIPVPGDYTGDGIADIAVFRPSTSTWYVNGGPTLAFGTGGDIPVPGDYTGEGVTDIAVFRPSTGTWFVSGGPTLAWGTSGDIPVPGDYDANGVTDIAVFRPSTGTWYVSGGPTTVWGTSGDRPLPLPSAIRQVFFP